MDTHRPKVTDLQKLWVLEYESNGTRMRIEYTHGKDTGITNYQAWQSARHEKDKLEMQGIKVILYHLTSNSV